MQGWNDKRNRRRYQAPPSRGAPPLRFRFCLLITFFSPPPRTPVEQPGDTFFQHPSNKAHSPHPPHPPLHSPPSLAVERRFGERKPRDPCSNSGRFGSRRCGEFRDALYRMKTGLVALLEKASPACDGPGNIDQSYATAEKKLPSPAFWGPGLQAAVVGLRLVLCGAFPGMHRKLPRNTPRSDYFRV